MHPAAKGDECGYELKCRNIDMHLTSLPDGANGGWPQYPIIAAITSICIV